MKPSSSPALLSTCILLALAAPAATHAGCDQSTSDIRSIPTLGGSTFYASAINVNGQLTGFGYLPSGYEAHAFLFGSGMTTDLGTFGGYSSSGYAINAAGHVVGEANLSDGYQSHAFLYAGSGLLDLGTLGGSWSLAEGINDAGQIVGNSWTPGDWSYEAFLYEGGEMYSLGHLGSGLSAAYAINRAGTIIGDSYNADYQQHGFVYKNGTMTDLGTLGGASSSVSALNNSEMIVGESETANGVTHAFLYVDGAMTDLGAPGGAESSAVAINDAGQVMGTFTTANDEDRGFFYAGGVMTDLGTLGGPECTPAALNNAGQIVGSSTTSNGTTHAFLWQSGVMKDLNTLLPPNSGWELLSASLINDAGLIIGQGTFQGAEQWFTLTLPGNQAPIAVAGADQTLQCDAAVTLDGSASSDPDGDPLTFEWSLLGTVLGTGPTLTCSLPLGANLVTLTVTDPCGASAQTNVIVNVVDTIAPTGSCPGAVTISADSQCQATVPDLASQVSASDNCTPRESLVIVQAPPAGTVLALGSHPVTITVRDSAGNASQCTTLVTVADTTAPVIVSLPEPVTLSGEIECQALVPDLRPAVVFFDNCSPLDQVVLTQNPAPGTSLPCGLYAVQITATDVAGNSASGSVRLQITDATAPRISGLTVNPPVLSPPNHDIIPVQVSGNVSDNCDPAPVMSIVSITCSEPAEPGEIEITGRLTANLAATRNPSGPGRVYTIYLQATDASGNRAGASLEVFVPKGNGNSGGTGKQG